MLKVDLPFFDIPYQTDTMNALNYNFFQTYSTLSMNQSMALTTDIYSAMHYGLKKLNDSLDIPKQWKNVIYYGGTAVGILIFAYVLPFGYTWMEREYTRSVLSRFGVNSFNENYNISTIRGVTGLTDNELGQFKSNAPYDFIRMNSAGSEGCILFSDLMTRKYFFYNPDDLSFVPALITVFMNLGLTVSPVTHEMGIENINDKVKEAYKNDKEQIDRFIAANSNFFVVNWVYELFRPNEPYADRGLHPSDDGSVARYITYNQLTGDEQTYLVRQSWLGLLNFVSPLLYGYKSFPLGQNGLEGNFALRHYLTSFGTDTSIQVFLKKNPFNMVFAFHNNINYKNWFPAIEAELVDYPLNVGELNMLLSPRMLIGMQPENQIFKTSSPEFIGLFGLRVDFMMHKNILPYFDFTAKTKGWIAGNEYLDANASVILGVSLRF
ncbi:MAG: hypothetical protein LBV17_05325 [Treponema sp.]|nr:hypothetical protein [Treponema sp.]